MPARLSNTTTASDTISRMSGTPSGSGFGHLPRALLDITHAVVTEVTDQAAVETRQTGDGRHVVARLEGFDEGQRVFNVVAFGLDAINGDADVMVVNPQHGAARQADDRVTAPFLAALHRFEQVGVGLVGQFQVDRQRRVEVGQGFAGQRNAVVAVSGQAQEFFADHKVPRGVRGKSVRYANAPAGRPGTSQARQRQRARALMTFIQSLRVTTTMAFPEWD